MARPQPEPPAAPAPRAAIVVERIAEAAPAQHPLAVYEQLLMNVRQGVVKYTCNMNGSPLCDALK